MEWVTSASIEKLNWMCPRLRLNWMHTVVSPDACRPQFSFQWYFTDFINFCTFCIVKFIAAVAQSIEVPFDSIAVCVIRYCFIVFGGGTCSMPMLFICTTSKIDYPHEAMLLLRHSQVLVFRGGFLISRTRQTRANTHTRNTCIDTSNHKNKKKNSTPLDLAAKIDRSARRCSLSMKIRFSSHRTLHFRPTQTRTAERLIAAVQLSRRLGRRPRALTHPHTRAPASRHTDTQYPVTSGQKKNHPNLTRTMEN